MLALREQLISACDCANWAEAKSALASAVRLDRSFYDRPVDLKWFCKNNNIEIVDIENAPFRGRLQWRSDRPARIAIKKGLSSSEYRFTLAHEIGHWLIQSRLANYHNVLFRGPAYEPEEVEEEEILADSLAIEMLLPAVAISESAQRDLEPTEVMEIRRKWMLDELTVHRSIAAAGGNMILSATVLPSDPNDEASSAIIDKVRLCHPNASVQRCIDPVRLTASMSFLDIWDMPKATTMNLMIDDHIFQGRIKQKGYHQKVIPQIRLDMVLTPLHPN